MASFFLSRSVGFHLVQSYLPTILIVVISWVSFWMDVDSVPGRTTLGVTTLLAVSSQSSGQLQTIRPTGTGQAFAFGSNRRTLSGPQPQPDGQLRWNPGH